MSNGLRELALGRGALASKLWGVSDVPAVIFERRPHEQSPPDPFLVIAQVIEIG